MSDLHLIPSQATAPHPRHPTQQLRLSGPFRDSSRQVVSFIPLFFQYISTQGCTLRSDPFVTAFHSDDAVVPR